MSLNSPMPTALRPLMHRHPRHRRCRWRCRAAARHAAPRRGSGGAERSRGRPRPAARWNRCWRRNSRCRPAGSTRPPRPTSPPHAPPTMPRWPSARPGSRCWPRTTPCAAPRSSCGASTVTAACRCWPPRPAWRCASATTAARASTSPRCCASPDDDGWRQALGVIGVGARDPQQAAKLLEQLVDDDQHPDKLQAWLAFGGLAQRLEQPQLAERIVTEVVRRFPGEPRVALLRASQLREADKPDEARQVLASHRRPGRGRRRPAAGHRPGVRPARRPRRAAATLARGPQDEQTYALRASVAGPRRGQAALTRLYEELGRDRRQARPAATPAAGPGRRVPRTQRRGAGVVPRRARRPATLAARAARRQRAA